MRTFKFKVRLRPIPEIWQSFADVDGFPKRQLEQSLPLLIGNVDPVGPDKVTVLHLRCDKVSRAD
jgi:hypothetical protein